jgi:hypothetical protein
MLGRREIGDYLGEGGTLDQFTIRRVIDILRAGGVTLELADA